MAKRAKSKKAGETRPPQKGGRPEFQPNKEQIEQAEILIGGGMSEQELADVFGLSKPTVRKHFAVQISVGRAKKCAEVLVALFNSAKAGNVSAQKAYLALNSLAAADDYARGEARETAALPRGKKEKAQAAALTAGKGTYWGDDLDVKMIPPGHRAN